MSQPTASKSWFPIAFAGFSASLVGIGLARFAYTPLLPALIEAEWFSEIDAVYLGAANLAGYLAGALGARRLARIIGTNAALIGMMLAASIAFVACAEPYSFLWYFFWRFVAGAAGGVLMVLAASTVLPNVPIARRGFAGGVIFTGVGLGIAASGTVVPALMEIGLRETWLFLGGLCFALTLASWKHWPEAETNFGDEDVRYDGLFRRDLMGVYISYGLCAVGLVAHMVFFVDYVARDLGRGIAEGATFWTVFGIGALVGPICAGRLADRIGFSTASRLFILAQAGAVALALMHHSNIALYVSCLIVGAAVPGLVPLVAGRVHEIAEGDHDHQRMAWSYATVAFSIGQAAAAYLYSYIFEISGRYELLFVIGAAAAALALLIDILCIRTQEIKKT